MPTGQNYVSTAPQTALVGGINNSQTTGTVGSFTGYPATPFTITFDIGTPSEEVCDVTGVSGDSITAMTRGVDGTSATSHANNATVTHTVIGRDFREMRAHIDASSSNDTTGHAVHGLASGSSVVGTTDTQTLTNKTLNSPTITGTANIGNPNITGTVTGGAQYQNIVAGTTAVGSVPLVLKGLANQTADLLDVKNSAGAVLFSVTANGATGAGRVLVTPTDTGNTALVVNAPSGLTASIFKAQLNAVDQVTIDNTGQLNLLKAPLSVTGITGVVNASRYVGATAGGPPSSGTFTQGDFAIDRTYGGVWVNTVGGSPGNWEGAGDMLLGQVTLGSAAASVSFNSIPSGFTNLILVVMAKVSSSPSGGFTTMRAQFSGDTTAAYGSRDLFVLSGNTPAGGADTSATSANVGILSGSNVGGTTAAACNVITIPYYTNPNFLKQGVWQGNGGAIVTAFEAGSGGFTWNSTGSVTSILLFPQDGSNFITNSIFQLFGRP